jgi:hypothetical protein
MPSDDKFPPEEQPTEPDLLAMPCPCCKEAGGFLVATTAHGVRSRQCDLCKGRRKVSKTSWRAYREQHK